MATLEEVFLLDVALVNFQQASTSADAQASDQVPRQNL
jgi:hypothetical protein